MEENYLVHHGILGMRWGIRRYQNKDGSLTPAGKRHAAELAKEYNDLVDPTGEKRKAAEAAKAQQTLQNAQQNANQNQNQNQNNQQKNNNNNGNNNSNGNNNNNKYGNNDIELVDLEFRQKVAQMKLQRDYLQAQADIAKLTPKKVSAGKKFMKAIEDVSKNPILQPMIKEAGATLSDKLLTKAGLKQPPQKSQKDQWKDQYESVKAKYDLESMAKKLYDEFGFAVGGTAAWDRATAAQNKSAETKARKVHTYKVKKRAVQADSFSTSTSSSDPILHDYAQLGSTFIAGLLGPSTVDAYLPGKH